MKYFRTTFLPLLLCGVILLSGYLSPLLFDLLTPDLKNTVESVRIASDNNPMYLESAYEVILPPWDEIDMDLAKNILETFSVANDEQIALRGRMQADIESFFPDIGTTDTSRYDDMTEVMQIYDNHLLFLKDYPCSVRLNGSAEKTSYKLDYVMDGWNSFPISLHLKGEETAPVSDERELRDNLDQIIDILKQGFLHLDIDPILNLSDPNTIYVGRYTEPLSDAFKALLSYDQTSNCVWLSIILNCQNVYALAHNNETLLIMVDTENLISCLFFDANTNRITGYSLDPKLVSLSMNKIRS